MHHARTISTTRTLPASDPPARMSEMRRPHDAGEDCAWPGGPRAPHVQVQELRPQLHKRSRQGPDEHGRGRLDCR